MKTSILKNFNIAIITFLTSFVVTGMTYAEPDFSRPMPEEVMQSRPQMQGVRPAGQMHKHPSPEEFERRLNLTEEQKTFAKEQRERSIEKIKPILDEISTKKAQIDKIRNNENSSADVLKLENEIKGLRKQAHEIRKENFKAFEATLSESQRKELDIMKNEGRKEFEKMHKLDRMNKSVKYN